MLRVLHLGDLHLGFVPSFLPQDAARGWQQERDRRLEDAVAWALGPGHPIDLVVIAGDLFEHHAPDEGLVRRVAGALQRLVDAGVGVVTVPGNHDEITYPNSVYRAWADRWPGLLVQNPRPSVLGPVQARGKPVYIYSCAYTGGVTQAWPPLDEFPVRAAGEGYHIGIFHGALVQGDAGARSPERGRCLYLLASALGRAGYDYVALGHIHRHEPCRAGSALAVYCGPPDGKGFDDPGAGCYTVVEVGPGHASVERVPVLTRRIRTVEVDVGPFGSTAELADHVRARLGQAGRPILRVVIRGTQRFAFDAEALAAELAPACFFVDVVDETSNLEPGWLHQLALEPTVRGRLAARALREMENAADDERRALFGRALVLAISAVEGKKP